MAVACSFCCDYYLFSNFLIVATTSVEVVVVDFAIAVVVAVVCFRCLVLNASNIAVFCVSFSVAVTMTTIVLNRQDPRCAALIYILVM